MSRVAANMGEYHVHSLDFELQQLGAYTRHIAMVDIATDGAYRRAYTLQSVQQVDIAYIPGVPNLIAVLEMDNVAIVPRAVRVRQYAYTFHFGISCYICGYGGRRRLSAVSAAIAFLGGDMYWLTPRRRPFYFIFLAVAAGTASRCT